MDNYFELFRLPSVLPVDLIHLNREYQELQRQYHPDKFAMVRDQEKMAIAQKSAMINDGYRVLKHPLTAAEHLLTLNGVDVSLENNIIHDDAFLMEQFELRETLDDIERDSNFSALDSFEQDINRRNKNIYNDLLINIAEQNWASCLNQVYKLRYLAKLLEQIEQLQEKNDTF